MSDTLITRDKLQEDLEDLYYNKIKPYLNGEGRTVVIRTGTITKESPEITFEKLPAQYDHMFDVYTSTGINYIAIDTSVDGECTVTYDENDIQENQEVEVILRTELLISSGAIITGIEIKTLPRRLNYAQGYKLNLDRIEITGYFSDGVSNNITSGTIFDPPNGTVLNDLGTNIIKCNFHDFTTTFETKVAVRQRLARLPYYFWSGCAVVYNNEIHLLGGYRYNNDRSPSRYHYKWNGSSWVGVSTLPYEFHYGCAVVYNNEIHMLGGYNSYSPYSMHSRKHYKWTGTEWVYVSDIPYDFYQGCAVVYNNEIHILGNCSGYYKYHYRWNGSNWASVSTLPYDFYNGCAVIYNNEIHILGGSGGNSYRYHYKWNGSNWSWASTLPYDFYNGCAVYYNTDKDNEIHILGGEWNNTYRYHYAWNGTSWRSKSTLPYNYNYFYGFGSTTHAVIWNSGPDEEIVILGGYGHNNQEYQKNCAQYDGSNWIAY